MRGKTRVIATALLAVIGLSTLAGCIVAPRGYGGHYHGHGGYYDHDHRR